MKRNATNIVINEIMSSKNRSAIILAKSDGEQAGFIIDLANNYRKTYWINSSYDNDYSLAYAIASKVFADNLSKNNVLLQYSYCKNDLGDDLVVVKSVMDYISSLNYNCLMVIHKGESIKHEFNLRTVETLLKLCPLNLKIVIISESFLDLNYSIFVDTAPKLITKEQLDEPYFDKTIFYEVLTERQSGLLYGLSKLGDIERKFLDKYVPEGRDLLDDLSAKYKSSIMYTDDGMYCFNKRLADAFLNAGKDKFVSDYDFDELLFEYYIGKHSQNYIKALKLALSMQRADLIERVIETVIKLRRPILQIYELAHFLGEINLDYVQDDQVFARYYRMINLSIGGGKYELGAEEGRKILEILPEGHPLRSFVISCYARSLYATGQDNFGAEYVYNFLENIIETKGIECIAEYTDIVAKLAVGLHSLNASQISPRIRQMEKYLLDEKFKDEFWYLNTLQSFAMSNLTLGNIKRAIEYVSRIKAIIPFYTIPYNMVVAYFYAGDMELAKRIADGILSDGKYNAVSNNLTNTYILHALISCYYKKYDQAISYLNEAIKNKNSDRNSRYSAIAFRIMVYAQKGMFEYAKDLGLLYVKKCEIENNKSLAIMHGAVAFCYWCNDDKEKANHHAKKCLQNATTRSAFWLISTAIIIINKIDADDVKSCKTLVEKFFTSCKSMGMEMLLVIAPDLFSPIIVFAEQNRIDNETLSYVKTKTKEREGIVSIESIVKVKFMGSTSISVKEEELLWKTKKAKELFLLYILKGEDGMDRNDIIEQFWGDYVYVSAINNLKTTNNIIRNTLSAHGVQFKLDYANSKYIMRIRMGETDYDIFKAVSKKLDSEKDLRRKTMLMLHLISLYDDGFAYDVNVDYFREIRETCKQNLTLQIVKLINELAKEKDYLEGKRFAMFLKKIQADVDYDALINELDMRILKL